MNDSNPFGYLMENYGEEFKEQVQLLLDDLVLLYSTKKIIVMNERRKENFKLIKKAIKLINEGKFEEVLKQP